LLHIPNSTFSVCQEWSSTTVNINTGSDIIKAYINTGSDIIKAYINTGSGSVNPVHTIWRGKAQRSISQNTIQRFNHRIYYMFGTEYLCLKVM